MLAVVALSALALPPPAAADPPCSPLPFPPAAARGRLGVRVEPMTEQLREYFHAPAGRGVLVTEIEPDSAAARAGLRAGDVIIGAGNEPVREPADLRGVVYRAAAGRSLPLRVVRDGRQSTLTATPEGEAGTSWGFECWNEWLQRGLAGGSEHLRRQLRDLERRLEELERKLDEKQPPPADKQPT